MITFARFFQQISKMSILTFVLMDKRYSRGPKTEKEDLDALRMPSRDQTQINRYSYLRMDASLENPPSTASLSGWSR